MSSTTSAAKSGRCFPGTAADDGVSGHNRIVEAECRQMIVIMLTQFGVQPAAKRAGMHGISVKCFTGRGLFGKEKMYPVDRNVRVV
jgi:hypothetical protein